jgi:hypothetical protein
VFNPYQLMRWACTAAAAATAALLVGCAANPGLAKFGGATASLADSYRPILARPSKLCADDRTLSLIATETTFDVAKLGKDGQANAGCAALAAQQETRKVVADAIAAYGQQLSLLAGADPGVLTADIDGVANAAKDIKAKGGDATFDGQRVDALSKIASILVELARAGQARRTAKDVMSEAQQPLESLIEEMKVWTEGTVIPRLQTSIVRRESLLRGLVRASDASTTKDPLPTYPARLAQFAVQKEIDGLQAEVKTAQAFVPAAAALVSTHKALRESFDTSNKEAQLAAVRSFVAQLRELHKAAQAL